MWERRGDRIKALREKRGWTQQQLADRIGVARVTVARVERALARPSLDLLERLARALRVKLTDLLE